MKVEGLMLDFVKEKFVRIPSQYRRWPTLGALAILLIVLPITVFGLLTGKFEIRKRAASGEVTPTPTPTQGPNFLTCNIDKDCACGTNEVTNQCAVGNKDYIDTSRQCPDFCSGLDGKLTTKCVSGLCQQTRISLTPTPVGRGTPTPTPTAPYETAKANLVFKIRLQGIDNQKMNKSVALILKQDGREKYEFAKVEIVSDQNGVYTGRVTGLTTGPYALYLRISGHLQKKIDRLLLIAGENNYDLSEKPFLAGDTNGDNKINAQDIMILIQHYRPNTPPNSPADFNADGIVNAQDVRLLIENYRLEGDE